LDGGEAARRSGLVRPSVVWKDKRGRITN
jgi:hypothetical protein